MVYLGTIYYCHNYYCHNYGKQTSVTAMSIHYRWKSGPPIFYFLIEQLGCMPKSLNLKQKIQMWSTKMRLLGINISKLSFSCWYIYFKDLPADKLWITFELTVSLGEWKRASTWSYMDSDLGLCDTYGSMLLEFLFLKERDHFWEWNYMDWDMKKISILLLIITLYCHCSYFPISFKQDDNSMMRSYLHSIVYLQLSFWP